MIYIKPNKTNKFVLTLSENSRLQNPFYLFVFENEFDLETEPIYWNALDISNYTNRYNLFEMIESSTGSTSGGTTGTTLSLIYGQYSYKVFESTGLTLSLSATTGIILEEGRMVVEQIPGSDPTLDDFTTDNYYD
jgi:hypothetical protein